mmetsp:Transcript_34718/g.82251  ORF Transcript_34718/g.82251 Transcript_34718/m.82251 type:complete len:234 (+) Transcript_34718:442-1143(+)
MTSLCIFANSRFSAPIPIVGPFFSRSWWSASDSECISGSDRMLTAPGGSVLWHSWSMSMRTIGTVRASPANDSTLPRNAFRQNWSISTIFATMPGWVFHSGAVNSPASAARIVAPNVSRISVSRVTLVLNHTLERSFWYSGVFIRSLSSNHSEPNQKRNTSPGPTTVSPVRLDIARPGARWGLGGSVQEDVLEEEVVGFGGEPSARATLGALAGGGVKAAEPRSSDGTANPYT